MLALGPIAPTSEFGLPKVGPVGQQLAEHWLTFRGVCQMLKGAQFGIVWKNGDQHGRILQDNAPWSERPRDARRFAVFQPLHEIIGSASADIQVQSRAAEIHPIGNAAEGLRLISYVSNLPRPEIGLWSGPLQRGHESVGIKHSRQPRNGGVAANEISFGG